MSELRGLPSVDKVAAALQGPHAIVVGAARRAVDGARARVRGGEAAPSFESVVADAQRSLDDHSRSLLRPVINATGVLIHTNLGRVPLGDAQLAAVERVVRDYSNLEYDLVAGRRGNRHTHARSLVTALTGAESALVVNNNAAAVLVTLAALCEGREVVISRGELIEIGGEFRIPDVMAASGARLVEVGTTNRTHLADYERALTDQTAAILKVHPSNYRVVGFTATVEGRELAGLAAGHGALFLHDLGSGLVGGPGDLEWVRAEPPVEAALAEGADVVTFSGDKLLGGPQAGIVAGRAELIDKIAKHPLVRAVRPNKMTLAALEATLLAYLEGRATDIPLWALASATSESLEARARALAEAWAERLPTMKIEAVASLAVAGGGSLPGAEVSSWAVALTDAERTPDELERALRAATPAIVGRIEDDRLLLDLRAVPEGRDTALTAAVMGALG